MENVKSKKFGPSMNGVLRQCFVSVSAVIAAILLGMVLILLMGQNPIVAFGALLEGAFGSANSFAETLVKVTPLLFTGMSYALANRCGLTNLGMEGQMYMGALTAAAVGIYVDVPAVLHIPLCILAGFVGGGLWGLLAGWLKVQFGASEIITTVMLNTIAIYFIEFMVTDPARMMEPGGVSGQSNPLLESARLDILLPNTRAHWGIIVGLVCVVLFWLFLWRSKKGYEVRVSGFNMQAAAYSGINTSRNILLVMLLSGGVAGLAGACEVMGVQGRLYALFSPGYGYDGIAVALIGLNSPLGIVFGALLFGAFRAGGNRMQMKAYVPFSIVEVIQAIVIIAVVASQMLLEIWNERQLKYQSKQQEA